jgi:hypothetical protein
MARRVAAGELESTWFQRHGSKPITDLPDHWPEDYRQLVERRIALIEHDTYINRIERHEYKRRWNTEPWEEQERRALRNWLLDRLEDGRYWQEPSLQTTRTLANKAQLDADFLQVAELYRGHAGFDVHALVAELVEAESIPFLPVLRYKPSGVRNARSGSAPGTFKGRRTSSMPRWRPLSPDVPTKLLSSSMSVWQPSSGPVSARKSAIFCHHPSTPLPIS